VDAYVPADWPEAVAPPGTVDWEASAVEWLLELVPDMRGRTMVRRLTQTTIRVVFDV
jgi:hypothetical protein